MTEELKDYAVTIKIRNNWMLDAMRKAGFETGMDLSRASGVDHKVIYEYLGLKRPFINQHGWSNGVLDIADACGCAPDALVPPQHLKEALKKNSGTFEASFDEVAALMDKREEIDPLALIEQHERVGAINEALPLILDQSERRIIELRWGLNGEPEHTLEQVGRILRVSRERIRQMEHKAFRKIRAVKLNAPTNCTERQAAVLKLKQLVN